MNLFNYIYNNLKIKLMGQKPNLRKRIFTVTIAGKRIIVDSKYCRVGSIYDSPIQKQFNNLKTNKDENKKSLS